MMREAGRFKLVNTEQEGYYWHGAAAGDKEEAVLDQIALNPAHWPVGTVVVVYEPENISEEEKKRISAE